MAQLFHRGAQGGTTELQLVVAWSFGSVNDVEAWLNQGRETGKAVVIAASMERLGAALVGSVEKKSGGTGG
jgi:hypothetical protein